MDYFYLHGEIQSQHGLITALYNYKAAHMYMPVCECYGNEIQVNCNQITTQSLLGVNGLKQYITPLYSI